MRMNCGEELRFYCAECQTEFDLTLEPKVQSEEAARTMPKKEAKHCPFCGVEGIEEA